MSQISDSQPHFLIIAGPNGSGKSSAYQASVAEVAGRAFLIINPDLFVSRLINSAGVPPDDANLEAVKRIESWLETSILAGHTVGVETVLSTAKYRRLVTLAKQQGYRVQLIYVILDDPRRNVEQVAIRVRRGGHNVPKEKIIDRYQRPLAQLPWFLAAADDAWLWDNSGASIRQIGEKSEGVISLDSRVPAQVAAAAQQAAEMDVT